MQEHWAHALALNSTSNPIEGAEMQLPDIGTSLDYKTLSPALDHKCSERYRCSIGYAAISLTACGTHSSLSSLIPWRLSWQSLRLARVTGLPLR